MDSSSGLVLDKRLSEIEELENGDAVLDIVNKRGKKDKKKKDKKTEKKKEKTSEKKAVEEKEIVGTKRVHFDLS